MSSLLLLLQAKHLPQASLQHSFRRAFAASVEPLFKVLNLDDVRHLGLPDLNRYGGQSFADFAYPILDVKRSEALGNGFVKGFRRYVERVRRLVQIVDYDRAGFKGHASNLSYSLILRLRAWLIWSARMKNPR